MSTSPQALLQALPDLKPSMNIGREADQALPSSLP